MRENASASTPHSSVIPGRNVCPWSVTPHVTLTRMPWMPPTMLIMPGKLVVKT